jgi:hypothetical protein
MWRMILLGLLVSLLLGACAGGGPPSDTVTEYLEGVYLQDVTIVGRDQCELTPAMVAEGYTDVWLVRYRFEGKDRVNGQLFSELDSDWEPYLKLDFCPGA